MTWGRRRANCLWAAAARAAPPERSPRARRWVAGLVGAAAGSCPGTPPSPLSLPPSFRPPAPISSLPIPRCQCPTPAVRPWPWPMAAWPCRRRPHNGILRRGKFSRTRAAVLGSGSSCHVAMHAPRTLLASRTPAHLLHSMLRSGIPALLHSVSIAVLGRGPRFTATGHGPRERGAWPGDVRACGGVSGVRAGASAARVRTDPM